jgi:cytochrome c biogenesis protein CcmG, thiol:disulfide interchange protein DsbE
VPRRALVVTVAGIAVVAAFVIAEAATSGGGGGARRAPALPTDALVSPPVTLAALHGRPAVVNFWASWCHPCQREAPELQRFAGSPPAGAKLVGVDFTDDRGAALTFIRQHRWHFPILSDGNGTVGRNYGVAGLPTTFVLDRRGYIVRTLRGPQTTATLTAAVRSAG